MNKGDKRMVLINRDFLREQIRKSGIKYADLAKLVGRKCEGSLTGAISAGKLSIDEIKKLSRILDFPYEKAIKAEKPKAYIKKEKKESMKTELDKIISMQVEINNSLMRLLQCNN